MASKLLLVNTFSMWYTNAANGCRLWLAQLAANEGGLELGSSLSALQLPALSYQCLRP